MKKALAIAGILALSITPTASFPHHLKLKESEIRPGGNLAHTNLSFTDLFGANLSDARLNGADLSDANLSGITATNLRGCPFRLPNGWVCEKNTIQICSYTTLIYNI